MLKPFPFLSRGKENAFSQYDMQMEIVAAITTMNMNEDYYRNFTSITLKVSLNQLR